ALDPAGLIAGGAPCVVFSPDGKQLLLEHGTLNGDHGVFLSGGCPLDTVVWVYDTSTWKVVGGPIKTKVPHARVLEPPDGWWRSPFSVFVRGGRQLFLVRGYGPETGGDLVVWEVAPGEKKAAELHGKQPYEIAVSPDGLRVVLLNLD